MRISDWSSDVCSSDLRRRFAGRQLRQVNAERLRSFHAGADDMMRLAERHPRLAHQPVGKIGRGREARSGKRAPPVGAEGQSQIGRAACRERVWQYVEITVAGVTLKKKTEEKTGID